ncbi:hypothetical protein Acr_03g0009310 [Actinidia rufa]|uniref:Mur ligase N-terminal catalytic domain-containing protein n=1 Tax=Actinidia rufa TaxID=165716 RepID=A0A7J0EEV1_9ERIC|nr:hypothetical protein Acr_03g0009310 [Actinidia rufa]
MVMGPILLRQRLDLFGKTGPVCFVYNGPDPNNWAASLLLIGPKKVQFKGNGIAADTSIHFAKSPSVVSPYLRSAAPRRGGSRLRKPSCSSTCPDFERARSESLSPCKLYGQARPISNRTEKDWLHFVGVGGRGLSVLAICSHLNSGSDIGWSSFMDGLQEAGARLYESHSVINMQKRNGLIFPKAIVVSSAIPRDNVEILYANSVGVPIYKRDYWLVKLTEHYNLIAVSGTHGKSTTASACICLEGNGR